MKKIFYGFVGLPNTWVDDNDKQYSESFFKDKDYNDYTFDNFYDMDAMFGHENSLFGTRGLPVGHPDRSSRSFDMYNKLHGPMIVRVLNNNLKESIRRIIAEETEGIDNFLNELSKNYELSEELLGFIKKFIDESECKRINFSKFKIGVLGLAIESGVLINSNIIGRPLPFVLFIIFHEIAHQYQFKKYGVDVMYKCYLGDITEKEAAEFMKKTEEVADEFASKKIKQLQKMGLIGPFTSPQLYKNMPIQKIIMMVSNFRNEMKRNKIDSQEKVSEYFYNIVKSEL